MQRRKSRKLLEQSYRQPSISNVLEQVELSSLSEYPGLHEVHAALEVAASTSVQLLQLENVRLLQSAPFIIIIIIIIIINFLNLTLTQSSCVEDNVNALR